MKTTSSALSACRLLYFQSRLPVGIGNLSSYFIVFVSPASRQNILSMLRMYVLSAEKTFHSGSTISQLMSFLISSCRAAIKAKR